MATPKGVTVVLIDPQGRVVANASDFEAGSSAGITRKEAQTWRAKRSCAVDYVAGSCNGYVAAAIRDGYPGADGLVKKLVADHDDRRLLDGVEPARARTDT